MKKQILVVCLLLTIVASSISGCGSSKDKDADNSTSASSASVTTKPTPERSKLVLWMPPFGTEDTLDKELWTNVTASFAKENNVDLQIEITPWENYEAKYLTGISSGNGPDVGYMYNEMIYDYINMGALEPLDNMLTAEDKKHFYYLDHGVIKGKSYGMPIVVGNARVLFYNKDILDAKGVQVPKTWEDFKAACKKVTDGKVYGTVMPWGEAATRALNVGYFPFLWQAGGDLISNDGTKVAFNSEAGLKALKFVSDLKNVDKSMPDSVTSMSEADSKGYFLDGKCAFIIQATNFTKQLDEKGIKWGYITSLTDKTQGTFMATDMLVMTSSSKNKEMAFKLMKHMLKGESMTEFHKMSAFAPVASDEEYNDNPAFQSMFENDKAALKTLPVAKQTSKIYDYLLKNIQLVMMGETTPEEALKNAEKYSNDLLNN